MFSHRGLALSLNHHGEDNGDHHDNDDNGDHDKDRKLWLGMIILVTMIMIVVMIKMRNYG